MLVVILRYQQLGSRGIAAKDLWDEATRNAPRPVIAAFRVIVYLIAANFFGVLGMILWSAAQGQKIPPVMLLRAHAPVFMFAYGTAAAVLWSAARESEGISSLRDS